MPEIKPSLASARQVPYLLYYRSSPNLSFLNSDIICAYLPPPPPYKRGKGIQIALCRPLLDIKLKQFYLLSCSVYFGISLYLPCILGQNSFSQMTYSQYFENAQIHVLTWQSLIKYKRKIKIEQCFNTAVLKYL